MKNKIFSFISIFSILFFPTYGNTFTHDKLKEGIEKGVKSLEQEINKQDNSQNQGQKTQQAQPKQQTQQAQPKQQTQQAQPNSVNNKIIKETNFVNRNHQEAVEYFHLLRGEIDKRKAEIESYGGLSGKQIYCKGRGDDRYGFYFII